MFKIITDTKILQ